MSDSEAREIIEAAREYVRIENTFINSLSAVKRQHYRDVREAFTKLEQLLQKGGKLNEKPSRVRNSYR